MWQKEKKQTVFIVSQRASSLLTADKIVVLDEGEVIGLGKHEELLKTCPVYREIYEFQYGTAGNGGENNGEANGK